GCACSPVPSEADTTPRPMAITPQRHNSTPDIPLPPVANLRSASGRLLRLRSCSPAHGAPPALGRHGAAVVDRQPAAAAEPTVELVGDPLAAPDAVLADQLPPRR